MKQDRLITCASCGMRSLERGGDTYGWKQVQLTDRPELTAYCSKDICQEAFAKAVQRRIREMRIARGLLPDPEPTPPSTRQKLTRSPLAVGADGNGIVFEPPPGGFAATEPTKKTEEEDDDPDRQRPAPG